MRLILCRFRAFRELEVEKVRLTSRLDEYRGVIESLQESERTNTHLVHGLQSQVEIEQAKRISAEAIAVERGKSIDRLEEQIRAANDSRDKAVSERAESLNLVNTALLKQLSPQDQPPVDISQFSRARQDSSTPPQQRMKMNRREIDSQIDHVLLDIKKRHNDALKQAEAQQNLAEPIPVGQQATG